MDDHGRCVSLVSVRFDQCRNCAVEELVMDSAGDAGCIETKRACEVGKPLNFSWRGVPEPVGKLAIKRFIDFPFDHDGHGGRASSDEGKNVILTFAS